MRLRLGPLHNPARGLLHGTSAVACASLAAHLSVSNPRAPESLALLLCLLCQSALFTVSALYHSVPWTPDAKRRMQRIDHAMIFVKISGTLTPVLWIGLGGWVRGVLVAAAWAITAGGTAWTVRARRVDHPGLLALKVAQGCLALPAIGAFSARAGAGSGLLLLAVACYLAGLFTFVTKRPVLFPRLFSFHELFHTLVVAGSAFTLVALMGALPAR